MSSYFGGPWVNLCVFLVGIVQTISRMIFRVLEAKMVFTVEIKTRIEVSMMETIGRIRVVAGRALLGWSGDTFPLLQGNA